MSSVGLQEAIETLSYDITWIESHCMKQNLKYDNLKYDNFK